MRPAYDMLGAEYIYTKALASRQLSMEDDLRALLAQYTEDETTLELFAATKLARLLQETGRPREPSVIERAALRYYVQALEKLRPRIPPRAEPLHRAYRLPVVARDVELIARRAAAGATVEAGELAYPEAPEVAAARRALEEGQDPGSVLRAAGFRAAAEAMAGRLDLLSPAVDVELLQGFLAALRAAGTELGRAVLGNRVDMVAARIAAGLVEARPGREILGIYLGRLATWRLPLDRLREAVETGDREGLEKLLLERLPRPPERIGVLEAFTAQLRRENRVNAQKIFTHEPLSLDSIIGLYETLLLDEEDAVTIALAGYSRQPKQVVMELVSIQR